MDILIVRKPVDRETLLALAEAWHKTFVKGVVDVNSGLMALGGEWHKNAQNLLITGGSNPKNLWGFSVYPEKKGEEVIEYESLINVRPKEGNLGREISNEETRRAVRKLVALSIPSLGL